MNAGYLPVALLGTLAVQPEAALVMTPVDIGLAIAAYWATNAVAAPIVGHRADQPGWAPTGALGVAMSGLILFLLAAVVGSKPTLMLAMAIAGVGLALCSQSSNFTIAREVPWSRKGRAFGLKQTAPPIIAMASGLIGTGIAVPFGWRWAAREMTRRTSHTKPLHHIASSCSSPQALDAPRCRSLSSAVSRPGG